MLGKSMKIQSSSPRESTETEPAQLIPKCGGPSHVLPFPSSLIVLFLILGSTAEAQNQPMIKNGGVVNAATFQNALSPGALVSLFGTNWRSHQRKPIRSRFQRRWAG